MVNVIIKNIGGKGKMTPCLLRNHLNYLHRQKDVRQRYSSENFDDKSFVRVYGKKPFLRLIVSPRKECDMKELLLKTIEGICLFNGIKSVHYVCYEHRDTEHPHLHLVMPDAKKKIDLSYNFIKNYLYPYVNNYLTEVYGKENANVEREEYIQSVYNIGASIIDYDIKRASTLDKSKKFLIYDEKRAERKNEKWKMSPIKERLKVLIKDKLAAPINGKIVLVRDFIQKKIRKGKIYLHLQNSGENIKDEMVEDKYIKKEDVKEVVSFIEKRHKKSYIVKGYDDKLYFFETKERKEKER